MKETFLIAPSLLSADFAKLGEEIESVTKAGADWIHVDVMDGHFVPNLTLGAPIVKCLKPNARIPLDVHLMIYEPEKFLEDFAQAGADFLTIHVESTRDPAGCLKKIRALGMKPGITLRPATPVEAIIEYLPLVDLVLIMTVNPGFGGQTFRADQIEKITRVRVELSRLSSSALIEVDGGINPETARLVLGADVLVAGQAVFGKSDYAAAIRDLKAARGGKK